MALRHDITLAVHITSMLIVYRNTTQLSACLRIDVCMPPVGSIAPRRNPKSPAQVLFKPSGNGRIVQFVDSFGALR